MYPSTIDRNIYSKDFFEYNLKIPCSTCGGKLAFDTKERKLTVKALDKESLEIVMDNDMSIAYGQYFWFFCGVAECRNCNAFTTISGRTTILPCEGNSCPSGRECAEEYFNQNYPHTDHEYQKTHYHHKITHIDPTPDLFPTEWLSKFEKYKDLTAIISEAFKLYWIDEYACANRIGVAIEYFELISNIKGFSDGRNSDLVLKLETLHDFRHAGSHYNNTKINREDILNAFDVLNNVLMNFFKINEDYEKEITDKKKSLDKFKSTK